MSATEYALITGASRGIGAAFAARLAAEHRPLILVARDRESLEALKDELSQQYGIPVHVLVADLTQAGAAREIHAVCKSHGWHVSLLINNAGMGRFGDLLGHPLEDYRAMISLNVQAPAELTHLFLADMLDAGQGDIINVVSMAAFQPTPYLAVYGASKAFLLSFSEAVAAECFGTPIRVLALCPGATRTDFFQAAGLSNAAILENSAMQTAEAVVDAALCALRSGKIRCVPGWRNRLMAVMGSLGGGRLKLWLTARAIQRSFGLGER